ncbi:MAG: hypothetical protein ACRD6X_18230, partial [Pyrinomonadaceae bacterium]
GLPDSFENALADGFTPNYFVSGGENNGTGFARFNNSVPQTVSQVFGTNPPISHFRVTPLRFETGSDGVQYGLLQIDYLTLWNRDDGLSVGAVCTSGLTLAAGLVGFSTSQALDGLGSHNLDNERSAMLVAAPVTTPNTFNTNFSSYRAFQLFTSAHEGTLLFDQSFLYSFYQPISFGGHVPLALSRSKHATYAFNPNFFPIFQRYIIYSAYAAVSYLRYSGRISSFQYLVFLYLLNTVFFTCAVDRFQNQGGLLSGNRINVGELANPINGSGFIRDRQLTSKLNRHF